MADIHIYHLKDCIKEGGVFLHLLIQSKNITVVGTREELTEDIPAEGCRDKDASAGTG